MALHLIHGPPNSGRAGLIRRLFADALDHDPVLIVPTVDDVFRFERELSEAGAALGGTVMTLRGLFRAVATAGGAPPGAELTASQRHRAIAVATAERRDSLGPLRRSATRAGFALAFERLLDELQGAGFTPETLGSGAETLESSAYLSDLATLFSAYVATRDRLGLIDAHVVAREAIALLHASPEAWRGRPVFFYELGDLTPNQRELIKALTAVAEVTVAIPYEEGNAGLAARASLLRALREIGPAAETPTQPDSADTDPLLFHLGRNFGVAEPKRRPADGSLVILRSAGARGEAEAIAAQVARLVAEAVDPAQIAIALRDPARRGPLVASTLESYGVAVALEAEVPATSTSVGGALVALLNAEYEPGRATDLLRFLRGPSGLGPRRVDWFERAVRRSRVQSASAALDLWAERYDEPPHDLTRIRRAADKGRAEHAAEVGRLAATMASRPLAGQGDGPQPERGDGLELRAAAAISTALGDLAELGEAAPPPEELAATIAELRFRAWSGPVEGRVRIASPYRLRASRFDHVIVGSLQDGEFPRRDGGGDPFLSENQRATLGLEPRRDPDEEERYLFNACLALPRRSLYLSYRDSDENGAAEPRSPLLDEVRRLLEPPPEGGAVDAVEAGLTRGRDLAQVVHAVGESPSETELARAIAANGADPGPQLVAAGVEGPPAARIGERIAAARSAETASRAPGPLTNPAVIDSLAAVAAYGGTTLEGFDVCSYRWFVDHELAPQPLDPVPDPLVQGGLMHAVLERLYRERPGGDPLPRPQSRRDWARRGSELVAEIAAERNLGSHPAERAMRRRVEGLLARFLAEEAERETGGFEPWLLEAGFGEGEDNEHPVLQIDGWGLHGAIDRVDQAPDGRALVLDYKLTREVAPLEKFEEQEKLQLQLYLIAVAEHWGAETVGGLYLPLRGTSTRRPRGAVLEDAGEPLLSYRLYDNDLLDRDGFEEMLAEARRRAGEIVARMRSGRISRDPGPRQGLRGHDVCPSFCQFAPICRRDRMTVELSENGDGEER